MKECYARKADDHEIKDRKKERNLLLRYTNSKYTNIREMTEKMQQYGTVTSIKNKKGEFEETQKESVVFLQQNQKQKEQWQI